MRAVIQRVLNASVSVDGAVISSIGRGLCVLIGVSRDDTDKEMDYIVRKILNLRLFEDDEGNRWSKSLVDHQLPVLCVSQFTLYAELKGNKPDFRHAMVSEESKEFYQRFLTRLKNSYKPELVHDGQFGAYMQVSIQNDGPVTITLENSSAGQDAKGKKNNKEAAARDQKSRNKNSSKGAESADVSVLESTEAQLAALSTNDSELKTDQLKAAGDNS